MRSQHIEEIRKNLEIEPKLGVPSSSPWSAAFTEAVRAQDFWDAEVISPSTMLLGRNRGTLVGLSSESSVESSPDRSPSRRESPKSSKPKVSKKGKKKYTGENKSRWDFSVGHYSLNRKGLEICINFNIEQCGNGKPQSRCTYHRSHQCNHCLGPHQATQCPTKSTSDAHLSGESSPPAQPARPDRRASAPESETLGQERPNSPAGLPPHKRHRTNHSDECAAPGSSGIRLVPRGRSPLPRKRQPPYKTPEPVLADGSIPKPPR